MTQTERAIPTLTIVSSRAAQQADGSIALVLESQEIGAIAIRVDRSGLQALRQTIARAEVLLARPTGNA